MTDRTTRDDDAPGGSTATPASGRRSFLAAAAGAAVLTSTLTGTARAQAFPNRPITLIVPFPAGGVTDIQFRAFAQVASKELGQPVVISNRPGATGTLAPGQMALTAPADGYTLSVVSSGQFRMPHVSKVPWDPLRDFTWILGVTAYTFGVAVQRRQLRLERNARRAASPHRLYPERAAHAETA